MRIDPRSTTVGQYFNEKWQAGLIRSFGVSMDTKVRSVWVVDNPASSYRFREKRVGSGIPQSLLQNDAYPICIVWNWFSPDDNPVSKIRMDYHADEDTLYILNQEQRRPSMSVSDVMKPYHAE